MKGWTCLACLGLVLGATVLVAAPHDAVAGGAGPSGAVQLVASGWAGRADRDWNPGPGFALTGRLPITRALELRADVGSRWLDGADHAVSNPHRAPRWGGRMFERSRSMRMIPITFDLVYHFERISKGRFWIPYAGFGPGFYDIRSTWVAADARTPGDGIPAVIDGDALRADDDLIDHNLFCTGWHLRGGVEFHRVSGLYLDLGSAVHFVGLPGRVSPLWEVSFGVGSIFSGARR